MRFTFHSLSARKQAQANSGSSPPPEHATSVNDEESDTDSEVDSYTGNLDDDLDGDLDDFIVGANEEEEEPVGDFVLPGGLTCGITGMIRALTNMPVFSGVPDVFK